MVPTPLLSFRALESLEALTPSRGDTHGVGGVRVDELVLPDLRITGLGVSNRLSLQLQSLSTAWEGLTSMTFGCRAPTRACERIHWALLQP